MLFPIRLLRGRWPALLEQVLSRFCWHDPTVVLDQDCSADDFRRAMSAIHIGGTIKITEANRHPQVDDLLLQHLPGPGVVIADVGASDGSTSLDLIRRLPDFKQFVIADLYLSIEAVRLGRRTLFFAPNDECVLIVGRRLLAWPSISKAVRILYSGTMRSARRLKRQPVLLLNPAVQQLMSTDSRVVHRTHDIFTPWQGRRPDIFKVANLLRRLYFTDEKISQALGVLHESLSEGGLLLLVDNPRIRGGGSRGGLYRRRGQHFEPVATTSDEPEIHELVSSLTMARDGADTGNLGPNAVDGSSVT